MRTAAGERAAVLVEALPYIRRWSGKTVVVKVGGEIVDDEETLYTFSTDVALMRFVGMRPVIVHGGGPQITQTMLQRGMNPTFIDGYRVTDAETVQVVKHVLLDHVSVKIIDAIRAQGARAVQVGGEDRGLLVARKVLGPEGQDLGLVGEVESVNPAVLEPLVQDEAVPVVAPLGSGPDGVYNINADLAAGALAAGLSAEKIVFLTNVEGLYHDFGDEDTLISQTTLAHLREMLEGNALSEGMIPKVKAVVSALESGVKSAHILDGREPHALLLEIFTDEGIGTMVLP
ncbi:MAG: acetylglutamate kinase [Actinomycetota bacterium]|nr:acetylglutamate kinase [Actinomycetota bacterium]